MTLKMIAFLAVVVLLALAAFIAQTPWRAHGGRFVTEYLLLASPIALVALAILALTLLWA